MTTSTDLDNHWPLRGDPTRLYAAAAVLRAAGAERIFRAEFHGQYVVAGVARLLENLALEIHQHVDLGHEVVSAATDIAEHVLAHLPRDRQCSGEAAYSASTGTTGPRRSRRAYEPFGLPVEVSDARGWPLR
jgi:hypothetical protein